MSATAAGPAFLTIVFVLAGASVVDLHRVEAGSLTVYTTPALRDLLEKGIFPAWRESGGLRVEPVYLTAGEQYNRIRMSGARSEADLFLHASPLFLEKGFANGYMLPLSPATPQPLEASYVSTTGAADGQAWQAFAWSPLVEVYNPKLGAAPDLAVADVKYGLAHPTLSNNGIYTVLFFETVSPAAGQHARERTVVQPVNARANILGVADGSFDVTLGYEAVARFFQKQGAKVAFEAPLVDGRRVSTPVIFCAGLIDGPHPETARRFVDFLHRNDTQALLAQYDFRSVHNITPPPSPLDPDLEMVSVAWGNWTAIEQRLPTYEVVRRG